MTFLFKNIAGHLMLSMIRAPDTERISIGDTHFVQKILDPPGSEVEKTQLILVVQGGFSHVGHISPYTKGLIRMLPSYVQIYVYGQNDPLVKITHAERLDDAAVFMKKSHSGLPLIMVGFSAGGSLIRSYQSQGFDGADSYFLVSSPYNMRVAHKSIENTLLYSFVVKQSLKDFECKTLDQLFTRNGTTMEAQMNEEDENNLILSTKDSWINRTVSIYGTEDIFIGSCEYSSPRVIQVKRAVHCCSDMVWWAGTIITQHLEA